MDKKSVYDIDLNIEECISGEDGLYNYLHLNDLKLRRLYLDSDVDQYSIPPLTRHIQRFNIDDKGKAPEEREPIRLYIASCGGSVDDGFELIDAIMTSKTPVYTVNIGYAYSMGFLLMLAGHKRFSMPNAKFLMHDGSNFVWSSGKKAQDQMDFNKRIEQRVRKYIIDRTVITPEEYDGNVRVEWYMFADEAKEKGVIDHIVGIDADIDEIL